LAAAAGHRCGCVAPAAPAENGAADAARLPGGAGSSWAAALLPAKSSLSVPPAVVADAPASGRRLGSLPLSGVLAYAPDAGRAPPAPSA
jgi:hypothetical protein